MLKYSMATTRIVGLDSLFVQIAANSFNSRFCTQKLKGMCLRAKPICNIYQVHMIIFSAFINHYSTPLL